GARAPAGGRADPRRPAGDRRPGGARGRGLASPLWTLGARGAARGGGARARRPRLRRRGQARPGLLRRRGRRARRRSSARGARAMKPAQGADLAATALYTAGTWAWAGFPGAELFDHADARGVFGATNFALALARPFLKTPASLRHSLVQRHVMIDRLL